MGPELRTRLTGRLFCHVPAGEPIRLASLVSDGEDDRWSGPGQPTVYLALDGPTILAELARHLVPGSIHDHGDPVRRRLLALDVDLEGLLDLRSSAVRDALGIDLGPGVICDRARARQVASGLRERDGVTGLIVPSVAFLDDAQRGNVVLFVERLAGGVEAVVRGQTEAGVVEMPSSAAIEE